MTAPAPITKMVNADPGVLISRFLGTSVKAMVQKKRAKAAAIVATAEVEILLMMTNRALSGFMIWTVLLVSLVVEGKLFSEVEW